MKRRTAIRNLTMFATGIALMPACNLEEVPPTFSNFTLESKQWQLLQRLTSAILPTEGTEISTPESTPMFVLNMLNDCFKPEDIKKYLSGLKLFLQYVQDEYKMPFPNLNPQQNVLMLTEITNASIFPKNLKFFLSTTKNLAVRHFTTSEHFMQTYLNFEFVPGRYDGCFKITT